MLQFMPFVRALVIVGVLLLAIYLLGQRLWPHVKSRPDRERRDELLRYAKELKNSSPKEPQPSSSESVKKKRTSEIEGLEPESNEGVVEPDHQSFFEKTLHIWMFCSFAISWLTQLSLLGIQMVHVSYDAGPASRKVQDLWTLLAAQFFATLLVAVCCISTAMIPFT